MSRNVLGLIGWLVVTFVAAAVGGAAAANAGTFYGELVQPSWAPPAWLFGPVWTVLYILMAVAAWLVWRPGGFRPVRIPLVLFVAQLLFNAVWSWLFFSWYQGALAFVDILILWVLILATIIAFRPVDRLAAWLMIPYLLWVTFASVLNYVVWQMNPEILG